MKRSIAFFVLLLGMLLAVSPVMAKKTHETVDAVPMTNLITGKYDPSSVRPMPTEKLYVIKWAADAATILAGEENYFGFPVEFEDGGVVKVSELFHGSTWLVNGDAIQRMRAMQVNANWRARPRRISFSTPEREV